MTILQAQYQDGRRNQRLEAACVSDTDPKIYDRATSKQIINLIIPLSQ